MHISKHFEHCRK